MPAPKFTIRVTPPSGGSGRIIRDATCTERMKSGALIVTRTGEPLATIPASWLVEYL